MAWELYASFIRQQWEETAAVLYFFDSGRESEHPAVSGVRLIRRDQIRWYEMASLAYSAKRQGNPPPSLAFSYPSAGVS